MARILICGGRDYKDWDALYTILDQNIDKSKDILIQGGAEGADELAAQWANERWVRMRYSAGRLG